MDKKILMFDTYAAALEHTLGVIGRRTVDLNVRHVLLVPEKDTLKCEQMLFSGGGAMDVDVYSLSRWFYKLGGGDVLPATGAVMILKDILYDMELKCFFRSKNFDGFCCKLYDTLCELDIAETDLALLSAIKAEGALGLKIADLQRISAEFKRRTGSMFVGRAGKIRLIAAKLTEHNFLHNTHIYAANWGKLSVAESTLFRLVSKSAKSFTMAVTRGDFLSEDFSAAESDNKGLSGFSAGKPERIKISAAIEIYKASGDIGCLKAAAGRIRSLAIKGVPFSDMCLVLQASAIEQAKRIFNEYDIPFYADKSVALNQCRLAGYLSLLIGLKRPTRKGFILLSKNLYSGIKPQESDVFENYCNAFLIDYLGFSGPFTLTDEDKNPRDEAIRLKIAEKVRKKLYDSVYGFWTTLDLLKNQGQLCEVLKNILDTVAEESPEKQRIFAVIDTLGRFLCGKTETKNSSLNIVNPPITKTGDATSFCDSDSEKNVCDHITQNNLSESGSSKTYPLFKQIDYNNDYDFLNKSQNGNAFIQNVNQNNFLNKIAKIQNGIQNDDIPVTLTKKRLQFLLDTLQEGIAAESLSALPRTQNCVVAGDAGIFKGRRFKHTFVAGFNEGAVPQISSGSGLVTEDECRLLNSMGVKLSTAAEINMQKEYEFMQLMAASENIFLGYAENAENRPSPLLYEITSLANSANSTANSANNLETSHIKSSASNLPAGGISIIQGGTEKDRLILSMGNDDELVRLAGGKNSALELLILTCDAPSRLTAALYSIFGNQADKYLNSALSYKSIQAEDTADKNTLFFKDKTVSVSQLQTYFSCPYKHFAEYGLRAQRRKSGRADLLDIGNAVHKVNELFAATGFDESGLEGIAEDVLARGVYRLKANQRLKERLKKEIIETCLQFGSLIKRGKFVRLGAEIRFGKNSSQAVYLNEQPDKNSNTGFNTQTGSNFNGQFNKQNNIQSAGQPDKRFAGCDIGGNTLKGSVDYADIYDGSIRIVDYKTGNAAFSEKELYYGRKLQLPLYMLTMRENGFTPAAMLYFIFQNKWTQDGCRFNGVFLADKDVLFALDSEMDKTGENAVVPAKIKITKKGEKITGSGAVDSVVFDAYLNYARQASALACRQIADGNISPSPLKFERSYACQWCGFLPACGFSGNPRVAASALIKPKCNDDNE